MFRMTQDGWKEVDNKPSGFANSGCGDLFIKLFLFLMGIGILALVLFLLGLIK
jgi:hypothetical protein